MLGLSTGLVHPDYTTSAITSWTDVLGLVAHYDFSDASKLKQNDENVCKTCTGRIVYRFL